MSEACSELRWLPLLPLHQALHLRGPDSWLDSMTVPTPAMAEMDPPIAMLWGIEKRRLYADRQSTYQYFIRVRCERALCEVPEWFIGSSSGSALTALTCDGLGDGPP